MQTTWQCTFRQPENPDQSTWRGTLASGASPDAQFIFDAIYAPERNTFVLTLLQVNDELGFIENEQRLYFATWQDLRTAIDDFIQSPQTYFQE